MNKGWPTASSTQGVPRVEGEVVSRVCDYHWQKKRMAKRISDNFCRGNLSLLAIRTLPDKSVGPERGLLTVQCGRAPKGV